VSGRAAAAPPPGAAGGFGSCGVHHHHANGHSSYQHPQPHSQVLQPLAGAGAGAPYLAIAGTQLGGGVPGAITFSHGFAADQNARFRKHMEDAHAAVADFADRRGSLFCGLYDGHGGSVAVDFVVAHLHATIDRELRSAASPTEPPLEATRRAFVKVDKMLLQLGAINCGTTAAVCLCLPAANGGGSELHVANAGDTRVVLIGDADAPARRMSVDHVATNADEVQRVQLAGGTIIGNRVGGSLAVTRALGDHALGVPVTADPHCVVHRLSDTDRFVLMASDGVWDVITDNDARDLVHQHAHLSNDDVCTCVVKSAIARGTRDNVSALLIRFTRP